MRYASRVQFPDLSHSVVGELGGAAFFSAHEDSASLRHHVCGVVGCGAEEEMLDVDAAWVIATVEDERPTRDRADTYRPCDPVRPDRDAFDVENAVAGFVPAGHPFDTAGSVALSAFPEEPFDKFFGYADVSHVDLRSGSLVRLRCDLKNRPEPFPFYPQTGGVR